MKILNKKKFHEQTNKHKKTDKHEIPFPLYILLLYETMIRHFTLTAFASVAIITPRFYESKIRIILIFSFRVCFELGNARRQKIKFPNKPSFNLNSKNIHSPFPSYHIISLVFLLFQNY